MTANCRHYWISCHDHYQCTECEATTPACCDCGRPTGDALTICQRCLSRAARTLDDIDDALRHYIPTPPTYIRAIAYDPERVREHHADTGPSITVGDIPGILAGWAEMWAETNNEPVNVPARDYLIGRHIWAAQNADKSAWGDYRTEMRALRHVARQAAGLLPKQLAAPCVHCGGTLVRDWADEHWQPLADGLTDRVRCTGCGLTWDSERHVEFANRQHIRDLPETMPDALITYEQARLVWPEVPAGTWRQWAYRDELTPDTWDERGVPLYRVHTLATLTTRRHADPRATA